MKLKPKYYKFLLKALIGIILSVTLLTTYRAVTSESEVEPVRIVQQHEQKIADSHYIISEEFLIGKLKAESKLVSMEQTIEEVVKTDVDKSWLGQRDTTIKIDKGTYLMGLTTSKVEIKHIDQENGIVYTQLPKPELIALKLPYDKIDIDKTQGWLRLSMSEEEEKAFYKSVENSIEKDILSDKEILNQANLNNQRVVRELWIGLPGVNDIIFSEEEQL